MRVKTSARVIALSVGIVVFLPAAAAAQSVNARLAALEAIVTTLRAEVDALRLAAAAEAAAREAGDLATLAAAKGYADSLIATEAAARQAGDAHTLAAANSYTDATAGERMTAISKTSSEIITLSFGSFANAVFLADVPAGSYVALGIVNGGLLTNGVQCDLEVSSLITGEGFRTAFTSSGPQNLITLPLGNVITLSQPGRAFIACTLVGPPVGSPEVTRAMITLIRVAGLDVRN